MAIFSDIKPLSKVFLKVALFASSFFFPFIFIMTIFDLPELSIYYALLAITIILVLRDKTKSKLIKKNVNLLGKLITIFGSLFVLFVLLNSYLKISGILYDFYQEFWEKWELLMNLLVLSPVLTFALIILYFSISGWLIKFIIDRTKKFEKFSKVVSGILTFVLFIMIPVIVYMRKEVMGEDLLFPLIFTLSQRLIWLFGFSLFFLHLNYLIKEIRKTLKRSEINLSQ